MPGLATQPEVGEGLGLPWGAVVAVGWPGGVVAVGTGGTGVLVGRGSVRVGVGTGHSAVQRSEAVATSQQSASEPVQLHLVLQSQQAFKTLQ